MKYKIVVERYDKIVRQIIPYITREFDIWDDAIEELGKLYLCFGAYYPIRFYEKTSEHGFKRIS